MKIHSHLATFVFALLPLAASAADPLTTAQVEKVVGVSGVQVKPSKYDKGGITFVTATGEPVVAVKIQAAAVYDVWKSNAGAEVEPVANVGADAFLSKNPAFVCFKKADKGLCVTSMEPVGRVHVSNAKLIELARVAAAGI